MKLQRKGSRCRLFTLRDASCLGLLYVLSVFRLYFVAAWGRGSWSLCFSCIYFNTYAHVVSLFLYLLVSAAGCDKNKSKGFMASKLSTYDFFMLYTTLLHHLIKDKLIVLIEHTFDRERVFFASDVYKNYKLWSCQNVCESLVYLLDNIFIRFGTKVYRQTIGIPMGTNCAPLVADLFLFCYESLSHGKIKLTLSRLSIPLLDTLVVCWMLVMFALGAWLAGCARLGFGWVDLILPTPKHRFWN